MTERPLIFSAPMVRSVEREVDPKTHTRRIAKPRRKHSLLAMEEGAPVWTDGYILDPGNREWLMEEAPCQPGDVLWTRENFRFDKAYDGVKPSEVPHHAPLWYEADAAQGQLDAGRLWPSIHMPRWASRRLLNCLDVRLERLNDISEADAKAEGISWGPAARHEGHNPKWIKGRCRDCKHWDTTLKPNGGKRPSCSFYHAGDPDPSPSYGEGCSWSFSVGDGADETARFQFRHFWDHLNGGKPGGDWRSNPWVWVIVFEKQKALA